MSGDQQQRQQRHRRHASRRPLRAEGAREPGRIYLVDASPADRGVARRYLAGDPEASYVFSQFGSGRRALAACAREAPACVVVEYRLPDMDGVAFVERLREATSEATSEAGGDLPCAVVMLTRTGDESVAAHAFQAGLHDYLRKDGLTPGGLRRAVGTAVAKFALARAVEVQRRALRASEARFRGIVQTANEGILLVDRRARTLYANGRLGALLGAPDAALLGRPAADFCFPEDVASARAHLDHALAGGTEQFEVRLPRADGSALAALMSTSPVRDAEGGVVGAVALLTDLTERRALERQTRRALEGLLAMAGEAMSGAPIAASAADRPRPEDDAPGADGRHVSVLGRMLEQVCGILACERAGLVAVEGEEERLRPLDLVDLVGRSEEEETLSRWRDELGEAPLRQRVSASTYARLHAGEIVARQTAPPSAGAQGPLVAPVSSSETLLGLLWLDYGARARAFTPQELHLAGATARFVALILERERLLHAKAEAAGREVALRETHRRMDDFLGIAAHEMRTPLTSILANLQLARRRMERLRTAPRQERGATTGERGRPGADGAPQEREQVGEQLEGLEGVATLLANAERQARRQGQLVSDLLDAAHIDAQRFELRRDACDLAAVVRAAVRDHRAA